ncbi:DNA polymerase I [Dissulfurirhabdus thermomarina]|uniref:DNA polymerase I n=1 Tax=Dissulfurirhabdus thermomarina TaxID=1765737 RepID=A0A6N9TPR4_DISTH|nr:DNA polymerase I [Dissulfurirhabdus thermomarina]NDY43159.1 DNA polymerase I [Dissulfurirhabdus thermomarina]NMX23939.1 DNA polymerase I [Dissulfurirhabdus thermomarina]
MDKNDHRDAVRREAFAAPVFLIDGSSYLYRAYFAIRQDLTTRSGFPTKAVLGVTNMLWKVLREKDPAYVAVAWDAKGPTFRHGIYPDYKVNRPAMPDDLQLQVPRVREVVEALGLPQLEVPGYEADDIIATLVERLRDHPVLVVSGDKDLQQLLGPRVTLWDPMKDEVLDLEALRRRTGLDPERLRDVMALSGDTSDNIPGVPGVGPKTALRLIREFGSLDRLLERVDEIPQKGLREKIRAAAGDLPLWRRLVTLATDVPVPGEVEAYRRRPPDTERLRALFQELGFTRLLREMVPDQRIDEAAYEVVRDEAALRDWAERARRAELLTLDTETTSEIPMQARLVGISLCITPPAAAYIPVAHDGAGPQLSLERVIEALGPVLADPDVPKLGQNIKYDRIVLARHGVELRGIAGDTMVASYLLDPSRRRHNLNDLAQEFLGHTMTTFKEVTAGQTGRPDFRKVPVEKAAAYACEDAHATALVHERLVPRLKEHGLWELYREIEVPLIEVLARMEMAGILVDAEGLDRLADEFAERLAALEQDIHRAAGTPFNVNSPRQLSEILFDRLKLPKGKKTRKRTAASTDVEVLTELAERHELPALVLAYRNLAKLRSTYVEGLRRMIHPETGRVHTSFNQTVTATGRLSSSEPNLQNIPVRTEEGRRIRALFRAAPGHVLLSADYSQIDLRVLAHYSGDAALLAAFRAGADIHRRTAAEIFDVHPDLVTPEMRRVAKTVNFGIIYGMSAYGLAKELRVPQKEAQGFIDRYFARYPGVRRYMEETVAAAREKGYVTTLLGRRRYIPDIGARVRSVREFAERTAINAPIQGTAADIIKLAMLRVDEALRASASRAAMLLQVHDELVLEVPAAEAAAVARVVKERMESVMELAVPLVVGIGTGPDWAAIEKNG